MPLRPYQESALDSVRTELRHGRRRVMLCLPTGGGKTWCAGYMIKAAMEKGSRCIFVVDREVLLYQTGDRLKEMGIPHGFIKAGEPTRMQYPVQVASAQTLENRDWWRLPSDNSPDFDLMVIDEAHSRRKLTEQYVLATNIPTVGLSATPMTRGLGESKPTPRGDEPVWQSIVNACSTNALIADGHLVPIRAWICTEIDTQGLKVNNGEWSDSEVASRALPITGDIVSEWVAGTNKHFGGPVPTIVFSATVAHGEELCRQFSQLGYDFDQISYRDRDPQERREKIKALKDGHLHGLVSCEALAKGFDETSIKCVVMARPYRSSVASVIQALGRGMRSHPDKTWALLNDHSGNRIRFAQEIETFWEQGWSVLDAGKKRPGKSLARKEDRSRKCRGCGFVVPEDAHQCPACGLARTPRRSTVETRPGKMVKYESLRTDVGDIWPHLSRLAMERHPANQDKAVKWARVQHKELLGDWPEFGRPLQPVKRCDPKVERAVRERLAKWLRQQHAIKANQRKRRRP